jgi:hypothetical protein
MTAHCCARCRCVLTFIPGRRLLIPSSDAWFGCPGCGRDVCAPCGEATGGRCEACSAAIVASRHYASWIRTGSDWRDELEFSTDAVHLIACASADVVDDLLAAATTDAPDFADHVAILVADHALGGLERVAYLGEAREYRLPVAWFANLDRVARRLAARAPARWSSTVEALTLVQGLTVLAPDRLPLPWPADLLHHDESLVRRVAGGLLDLVAFRVAPAPRDRPARSPAELAACLDDREQHPWERRAQADELATCAAADDAARARLLALIDDGQELVDVRVHAAVALALAAPGDAPPAARLAEAAAPILRAAGHVLGARARADDPCLLLRYLASSSDLPLTAWCAAHPDEVAARRARPRG